MSVRSQTTIYVAHLGQFVGGNPDIELLYRELAALGWTPKPLTRGALVTGRCKYVHLYWPEWCALRGASLIARLDRALFIVCLVVAKLSGASIFWTMNNLVPHESQAEGAPNLTWWVARLSDHVFCVSSSLLSSFRLKYGCLENTACTVLGPLAYSEAFQLDATLTKQAARNRLGVASDRYTVGSFGALRTYKNLPAALSAFTGVHHVHSMQILVAGEVTDDELRAELQQSSAHPSVYLTDRFLSVAELSTHYQACDVILLNSASGSNSGSAMLALTMGRPIIAPATTVFLDLQSEFGSRWVRTFDPPLQPSDIELAFVENMSSGRPPISGKHSWRNAAAAYHSAFLMRAH